MLATNPPFTLASHNAVITVRNNATGNHRTFRLRTQKPTAKFAPGMRILSLLIGPDNTSQYKGFAFVDEDGNVYLWKRYKDSVFESYVALLRDPYNTYGGKLEWFVEGRCRVCNRRLTVPDSIESGIGPKCAGK